MYTCDEDYNDLAVSYITLNSQVFVLVVLVETDCLSLSHVGDAFWESDIQPIILML